MTMPHKRGLRIKSGSTMVHVENNEGTFVADFRDKPDADAYIKAFGEPEPPPKHALDKRPLGLTAVLKIGCEANYACYECSVCVENGAVAATIRAKTADEARLNAAIWKAVLEARDDDRKIAVAQDGSVSIMLSTDRFNVYRVNWHTPT